MNKFMKFVKWVIDAVDNQRQDTHIRVACLLLSLLVLILLATATLLAFMFTLRFALNHPFIALAVLSCGIPIYIRILWLQFEKDTGK